ncbi:zinc finger BED domain-containing protein DAYSLEEPER-like [Lycium barbarum]|uniref:zinc finger BED domain-containing protein DAYSLEEPER-like n=1 Tax=Lycium barbarum TaxID=112863 RepID=UPI00293EE378|nr:zinc finger BED domain-containing protein DAYSLEEPER-like [Lycium barbarum]
MTKTLPNFKLPSRVTIARHCLRIYQEEKDKLKYLIKDQRVCLTSDTWTSLQNLSYMVVTAHWIDDRWNSQKKILNFFPTPDHKGETIAKGIEEFLLGWGIDNLFTVTLDNATANDAAIKHLKVLMGTLYVTSNCFFREFFTLRSSIKKYSTCEDLILVDMADMMKSKFDKYWGNFENMNMLLLVAVVLDPRYKMKYVNFTLSKAYGPLLGRLKSEDVASVLTRLYDSYSHYCKKGF